MPVNQIARVIEPTIHTIRGQRVMLDSDLAKIYEVSIKRLNQQVHRNRVRFPDDFAFQITREKLTNLKSQTSNGESLDG